MHDKVGIVHKLISPTLKGSMDTAPENLSHNQLIQNKLNELREITYISERVQESLDEHGIENPSEGLKSALHSAERMRLEIQKFISHQDWSAKEKNVRPKHDKSKKHAQSLKFVIKTSHRFEKVSQTESEIEILFRFPTPHTVTVEITTHHHAERLGSRSCVPYQNLTEHMTASFKYAKVDNYNKMVYASNTLETRTMMHIKALVEQTLTPIPVHV